MKDSGADGLWLRQVGVVIKNKKIKGVMIMFGKSKKQEEVLPDINDMSFDDLVAMGLVDDELANSLGDYLGNDKTLKDLTEEPPKPEAATAATAATQEQAPAEPAPEEPVKPAASQPNLTVLTGPHPNLDDHAASPLGDALQENEELHQKLKDAEARIKALERNLAEERAKDTDKDRQEIAEILIESRAKAKKEIAQAQEKADQLMAAARTKAQLTEVESKQRQAALQSYYQNEQEQLKAKFQQMQEYFTALKANADLLFTDYLGKTEQIIKELEE